MASDTVTYLSMSVCCQICRKATATHTLNPDNTPVCFPCGTQASGQEVPSDELCNFCPSAAIGIARDKQEVAYCENHKIAAVRVSRVEDGEEIY